MRNYKDYIGSAQLGPEWNGPKRINGKNAQIALDTLVQGRFVLVADDPTLDLAPFAVYRDKMALKVGNEITSTNWREEAAAAGMSLIDYYVQNFLKPAMRKARPYGIRLSLGSIGNAAAPAHREFLADLLEAPVGRRKVHQVVRYIDGHYVINKDSWYEALVDFFTLAVKYKLAGFMLGEEIGRKVSENGGGYDAFMRLYERTMQFVADHNLQPLGAGAGLEFGVFAWASGKEIPPTVREAAAALEKTDGND